MATERSAHITEAHAILRSLGMPRAQCNPRSALCLLALLDLRPGMPWAEARNPLLGITPIMDWARTHYKKHYAPNSRETFRRQTMHQFVQAGIALYNPDQPDRPVNSPYAVYQISPRIFEVLRGFGTARYEILLKSWLSSRESLSAAGAMARKAKQVPVTIRAGEVVHLSPGGHSNLIRAVWETFGPQFVPGGQLVYVGDTGDKAGFFDRPLAASLGISVDAHGKMPDVIIYFPQRNWLVLAEAVISHGPIDAKRHKELRETFSSATAGLVFVSAFPDRQTFSRHQRGISWESEVWIADSPAHLIHFNGARFLGPHEHPAEA